MRQLLNSRKLSTAVQSTVIYILAIVFHSTWIDWDDPYTSTVTENVHYHISNMPLLSV